MNDLAVTSIADPPATGKRPDSLVALTARALTELSLAAADGDRLGSEDELLARLGVSRPTLRQAAKIVESDRLVSVRRGIKGGFYVSRPNAADAIRAPARYLRLNGATISDVHRVTRLIAEEMAAAAATEATSEARERLSAFRATIDAQDTAADMVRSETELMAIVAAISGNPAAVLFMEIGYTFGRNEPRSLLYRSPAERTLTRELQHALCDAILAGDAQATRRTMQRRSLLFDEWLGRDETLVARGAGRRTARPPRDG